MFQTNKRCYHFIDAGRGVIIWTHNSRCVNSSWIRTRIHRRSLWGTNANTRITLFPAVYFPKGCNFFERFNAAVTCSISSLLPMADQSRHVQQLSSTSGAIWKNVITELWETSDPLFGQRHLENGLWCHVLQNDTHFKSLSKYYMSPGLVQSRNITATGVINVLWCSGPEEEIQMVTGLRQVDAVQLVKGEFACS